jgi:hypothetical protein
MTERLPQKNPAHGTPEYLSLARYCTTLETNLMHKGNQVQHLTRLHEKAKNINALMALIIFGLGAVIVYLGVKP